VIEIIVKKSNIKYLETDEIYNKLVVRRRQALIIFLLETMRVLHLKKGLGLAFRSMHVLLFLKKSCRILY
jgi:hypothetical protein